MNRNPYQKFRDRTKKNVISQEEKSKAPKRFKITVTKGDYKTTDIWEGKSKQDIQDQLDKAGIVFYDSVQIEEI